MHFIKRRTISIAKINTERIVLSKTIYMVKFIFKVHCMVIYKVYSVYNWNNTIIHQILVHDKELLKKYKEIWNISSNLQKKNFHVPVYNNKFIRTKIKICNRRINVNFPANKMPDDNRH